MSKIDKLTFAFTGDKNFDRYDIIANATTIGKLHVGTTQLIGAFKLNGSNRQIALAVSSVEEGIIATAKMAWTGHKFTAPTVVPGKSKAEVLAKLAKNQAAGQRRMEKADSMLLDRQAWKFAAIGHESFYNEKQEGDA